MPQRILDGRESPAITRFRVNLGRLTAKHGDKQALADKTHLTRGYISYMVTKRDGSYCPTLEVALRICKALGVDISDMCSRKL